MTDFKNGQSQLDLVVVSGFDDLFRYGILCGVGSSAFDDNWKVIIPAPRIEVANRIVVLNVIIKIDASDKGRRAPGDRVQRALELHTITAEKLLDAFLDGRDQAAPAEHEDRVDVIFAKSIVRSGVESPSQNALDFGKG